jgi:hypothetical protein
MIATRAQKNSNLAVRERAVGLLEWLIDFLPSTIPPSAERAIIEDCDDVHALFDHRSELEKLLETAPDALNQIQKEKLAELDRKMRAAALLLFGASKGTLRRQREGRYDRSHWWWYIDDLVREANLACNQKKMLVEYARPKSSKTLMKAAEERAEYVPKASLAKAATPRANGRQTKRRKIAASNK